MRSSKTNWTTLDACPYRWCGAGPGEPCRTGYFDLGKPILANEKHDVRQAAADTRPYGSEADRG